MTGIERLMNTDTLASRLRLATREAHRGLDHHPLLQPLVDKCLRREDYACALAALHGPQAAIESRLADFAPPAVFPTRLADLDADLAALRMPPQALHAELPDTPTAAAHIGLMYVIEGSRLGGAAIARCLASSQPHAPRRFFSNAAETGRWERFWALAEHHCTRTAQVEEAIATAVATFDCYHRHLNACREKLLETLRGQAFGETTA